mmetsp:Transcript_7318/g.13653  ORF Transcript_7318/g.13653 Transcript_7318/m.13653 type:complete len:82 (+) Transcript_7318:1354-1599(+)
MSELSFLAGTSRGGGWGIRNENILIVLPLDLERCAASLYAAVSGLVVSLNFPRVNGQQQSPRKARVHHLGGVDAVSRALWR